MMGASNAPAGSCAVATASSPREGMLPSRSGRTPSGSGSGSPRRWRTSCRRRSCARCFSGRAATTWWPPATARNYVWSLRAPRTFPRAHRSGSICRRMSAVCSRAEWLKRTRNVHGRNKMNKLSRRHVLKGTAALAAGGFVASVRAAAPPASSVTPALIDAAKKEGKVVWYTSLDLPAAEKVARAFEAKYAPIAVRVERTGGERVFQRVGQEYAARIHAVDVVQSSDAAHFI